MSYPARAEGLVNMVKSKHWPTDFQLRLPTWKKLLLGWVCYWSDQWKLPKWERKIYIPISISSWAGSDKRSIFKRGLTCSNSEFSFAKIDCHTKVKDHTLSYFSPWVGGRITGFRHFPWGLVLREMRIASSRIWTRICAVCIFIRR